MSIYTKDGKILIVNGKIATAQSCCCNQCGACCWKITSAAGCPQPKVTVEHGSPPGVRIDFADSSNCNGPCGSGQSISLTTQYNTTSPITLNVTGEGLVETQNAPFDILSVNVNGTNVLFLQAFEEGGGCRMKQTSGSGSIQLPAGCHTITITSGTNDALFHVGFYYKVNFSVSGGQGPTCEGGKVCNGYDCDQTYGCQPATTGGQYPTLAACEESCGDTKKYYCNQYQGCRETFDPNAPYSTLSECEAVCKERFTCDVQQGCKPIGFSTDTVAGAFETLAACQSSCNQLFKCDPYYACMVFYDTVPANPSGNPPTWSDSQCGGICRERYQCDTYQGCVFIGNGTTGDDLVACQQNCTVKSYDCDPGSGCVQRYDTQGLLIDCTTCEQRYQCDTYSGCLFVGYSTAGNNLAACQAICTVQSYECNQSNGCLSRYDANGPLSDCATCEQRYVCDTYYGCSSTGYATTGDNLAACQAICTVQSYECNQWGGCTARYDANGSLTDCSTCTYNYTCQYYWWWGGYSCQGTGYAINGTSLETCQANCPPPAMTMPPDVQALETAPEKMTLLALTQQDPRRTGNFEAYVSAAPQPRPVLSLEEQDPIGPGTFLSKMLEKIGIKSSPTCSCKARARHMNENGVDWCANNVPMIVGWLREEAEKRKLPFIDMAGTLLVKRAISLSRAAKKKQAKNESTASDRTDS